MLRLKALTLAATLTVMAACTQTGAPPLSTTVCDLARSPQRLVQIKAEVRLRSDGQAVITDASCAAERIELRLTGTATRAGLEGALREALKGGADGVRVPVSIVGVYVAPPDGFFTAEALSMQATSR